MADIEEEEEDHESYSHDLLIKLKKTTEGLLAGHSVQGVWGTYGGLRRVCLDTETILCHRIKKFGRSNSDDSYWQFVLGLKWLSPSLAPLIDKLNRLSQSEKKGGIMAGRAWLRDSVQEHSLITQLDILIANKEHLHNFYHEDAFLWQPEYVQAMKICFKAIELNKPALLTDINPHLLRSGRISIASHSRSASLLVNRASELTSWGSSPSRLSQSVKEVKDPAMGNKHPHLHVNYSPQLSSSSLSLTVDPSLGVTSLLHQKNLSDPYFVASLDSPRLLEHLGRDPFAEAYRINSCLASTFQNSRLSQLRSNEQGLNRSSLTIHPPTVPGNEEVQSYDPHSSYLGATDPAESEIAFSIVVPNITSLQQGQSDVRAIIPSALPIPEGTSHSSFSAGSTGDTNLVLNPASHSHTVDAHPSGDQAVQKKPPFLAVEISGNASKTVLDTGHDSSKLLDSRDRKSYDFHSSMQESDSSYPLSHDPNVEAGHKRGSIISLGLDAAVVLNECVDNDVGDINHRSATNGASQVESASNTNHLKNPVLTKDFALTSSKISNFSFQPGIPKLLSGHSIHFQPHNSTASSPGLGCSGLTNSEQHLANTSQRNGSSSTSGINPKIFSVKSDPALNIISDPLLSPVDRASTGYFKYPSLDDHSVRLCSPGQPWADTDLYRESMDNPCPSPIAKNVRSTKRLSSVYIPQPLTHGSSSDLAAVPAVKNTVHNPVWSKQQAPPPALPPSASATRKLGHKRWMSDTGTIRIDQLSQSHDVVKTNVGGGAKGTAVQQGESVHSTEFTGQRRSLGFGTHSYHGTLTKPTEGQSLMSYLTSQDFNTCANLEKENAHFHISEALIAAFESMKWNRMMKKRETGRQNSSSSSSDEEIHQLRQRIRIRKREKMMEKGRPFPSLSDGQTDTATTSQSASSLVSSEHEFSSMSGSSDAEDEADGTEFDISNAELQRSNQQVERNSSFEESTNPGSAESIAISLLRKFSEKHLPKASELKWLVSERDAPQRLLPLPSSIPVSPDDSENADLATGRTRLRGNLEWAPPRAQIIFSVHPTEKRATVMARQNFRCTGCGMRVDPAFIKRYKYCEYLGKYFCQCCHTGEMCIIPGRVIERWDFSRYPVSTFSHSLLEKMWKEPLFHVDTINASLYKRIKGLESIREGRQQLIHLHSLLGVCKRDPKLIKEILKLPSHWITNDDAYSMDDFTQVKSGTMLTYIKSFISLAVSHVRNCQLCQGLGFICGMCQDQQVIFPFQLETVIRCPVCQSCYHKECFIPDKCPKCIRLEARRKMQQEPLLPDSPDSGDTDHTHIGDEVQGADSSLTPVGSADTCR